MYVHWRWGHGVQAHAGGRRNGETVGSTRGEGRLAEEKVPHSDVLLFLGTDGFSIIGVADRYTSSSSVGGGRGRRGHPLLVGDVLAHVFIGVISLIRRRRSRHLTRTGTLSAYHWKGRSHAGGSRQRVHRRHPLRGSSAATVVSTIPSPAKPAGARYGRVRRVVPFGAAAGLRLLRRRPVSP